MSAFLSSALMYLTLTTQGAGVIDPLAIARNLQQSRYSNHVYGSSGKGKIDCVQFVNEVVKKTAEACGKKLTTEQANVLRVVLGADDTKNLNGLVKAEDNKIKGVQRALDMAGLGVAVDRKDAKAGDFVQYWYKVGEHWLGHAGIIESIDRQGRATIYGSHKTTLQREKTTPKKNRKGGIGSGPVFDLKSKIRKVFVVRWTASPKDPDK